MSEGTTFGNRSRGESIASSASKRGDTPGSPRRTHTPGRDNARLHIQGINTKRDHKPIARKKRKRKPRAKRRDRDQVNEAIVETKLKLRDMCKEANARVDEAMEAFHCLLEADQHKLNGKYAGSGTTYEVLSEIKTQTEKLHITLEKIGWDRDGVLDELNMWAGTKAGEASVVEAELRGELLESKERTLDLIKDSSLDFKEREDTLMQTTGNLSSIFAKTVDTAASEIKIGAKKYARVAVARERAKILASKEAINIALKGGGAPEKKRQDRKDSSPSEEGSSEITDNELDNIVADPDPDVLRLIEKWKEEKTRAKKAENTIHKYELAKFAADEKLARAMSDWEDKRDMLNKHIKEARDELRLTQRKLIREKQRAKEKEVRDRNQKETESFIEKNSKRKGTEMLKMQLATLKKRVSELEKQVEESENAHSELELEVSDLQEQLEATKSMVTREEYENIKRQLFEASDQIDAARKETAAAQKEAEDAREVVAQAELEKAKVQEKLDLARREIKDLNGEIENLNKKLVDAEEDKKRALAEQQAKHDIELEKEKEKTRAAEERAAEAEAMIDQLRETIEEIKQEIEDLKEAHRVAMEELREQHAEHIRQLEEEFEREKQILEDKIDFLSDQIQQIKRASGKAMDECLEILETQLIPLSNFAVKMYGRAESLRKFAEEGKDTPPEKDGDDNMLTKMISNLGVGSAIDLSNAAASDIENLAETSAKVRLHICYDKILKKVAETEAYKSGLLSDTNFGNEGLLNNDLIERTSKELIDALDTFHKSHVSIANKVGCIDKTNLPDNPNDSISIDMLLERRQEATNLRLSERKAREEALRKQGEALQLVKTLLEERTRDNDEMLRSVCRLDVACAKVQYHLETGGLHEDSPSVREVLAVFRHERTKATAIVGEALLGRGILITSESQKVNEIVELSCKTLSSLRKGMHSLRIAMVEVSEPETSELVNSLREKTLSDVEQLLSNQKVLADFVGLRETKSPKLADFIARSAELHQENISTIQSTNDSKALRKIQDVYEETPDFLDDVKDICSKESAEREDERDRLIAEQEGKLRREIATLQQRVEMGNNTEKRLKDIITSLRTDTVHTSALTSRLCDYIGTGGELGNKDELLETARQSYAKWSRKSMGIGFNISSIDSKKRQHLSNLRDNIENWLIRHDINLRVDPASADSARGSLPNISEQVTRMFGMQKEMISNNLQRIDGDESNELESLVQNHIQLSLQLLQEKVKICTEINVTTIENLENSVNQLTQQHKESEKAVMAVWFARQKTYYEHLSSDELEQLRAELEQLLNKIKLKDEALAQLRSEAEESRAELQSLELQLSNSNTKHMEAIEAAKQAADEATKRAAEEASAVANRVSRGRSRGKSRGKTPIASGSGAMEFEELLDMVEEYRLIAQSTGHISIIAKQLRQIAPPKHKLDIEVISELTERLHMRILKKLPKLDGNEQNPDEVLTSMNDAIEAIDPSHIKHLLVASERLLSILARKILDGIFIGRPHKTPIDPVINVKDSLRVSRGSLSKMERDRKSNCLLKKTKRNINGKNLNVSFAHQHVQMLEMELELKAMSRQVRGFGKLEEVSMEAKKAEETRGVLARQRFKFMTDSLEAECAEKKLLQYIGAPDDPATQSEIEAIRFCADKKASKARKQKAALEKTERRYHLQKIKLLKSYEDFEVVSSKVMGLGSKNMSSAKRLTESKMRRYVMQQNLTRLGNRQSLKVGKNTQSMGALLGKATGNPVGKRRQVFRKGDTKAFEASVSLPRLG